MTRIRWRKLRGDVRAAWGRWVAVQLVLALALAGVGVVLGARTVLRREIRASYASARPADATFELRAGIDDALIAAVRARPEVEAADRREVLKVRVRPTEAAPWQTLVLFAIDDFAALGVDVFRLEHGAWPPPRGAMLVERTAPAVMGIAIGGGAQAGHGTHGTHGMHGMHGDSGFVVPGGAHVLVQTPHGAAQPIAIAGTVHDAGQAPAWQEHHGYGYVTLETLAALGEPAELHDLVVRFRPAPVSRGDADARASTLAAWLRAGGHEVHEVRVPPLRQHPHQRLMDVTQLVLLGFSVVLLLLSAIVASTMLSAMLARQVREIGVMKAIGASAGQLAAMYVGLAIGLGVVAAAIALPLSHVGAAAMIQAIGGMMNLRLDDPGVPAWVYAAIAVIGVVTPMAFAWPPIRRATRITVNRALAHHGVGAERLRPSRLPIPIRNALRRPGRLAVTVVLLVVGGALVIAAANVERGLGQISAKLAAARHYDLEVRLYEPIAAADVMPVIGGVRAVEAWSIAPAARVTDDAPGIVRTYPDGGHGSFLLAAPPAGGTALVAFPLTAGRWLAAGDVDAVVLGHNAAGDARVGDRIELAVDGVRSSWTVVGIVEEVGGGSAFVTAAGFATATGGVGPRLLRIATGARTDGEREAAVARIERELARAGVAIEYAMPTTVMRSIIDDHVALVARAVIGVAAILALVGLLALASAMAINVAERTRELGIMKAIGAGDRRVAWIVVGEALAIGLASAVVAVGLAVPLTVLADELIARRGFLAPPPFAVSLVAVVGWPVVIAVASVVASLVPARRAVRLTVREALSEV